MLFNRFERNFKFAGLNSNAKQYAKQKSHTIEDAVAILQDEPDMVYEAIKINGDIMTRKQFDALVPKFSSYQDRKKLPKRVKKILRRALSVVMCVYGRDDSYYGSVLMNAEKGEFKRLYKKIRSGKNVDSLEQRSADFRKSKARIKKEDEKFKNTSRKMMDQVLDAIKRDEEKDRLKTIAKAQQEGRTIHSIITQDDEKYTGKVYRGQTVFVVKSQDEKKNSRGGR